MQEAMIHLHTVGWPLRHSGSTMDSLAERRQCPQRIGAHET